MDYEARYLSEPGAVGLFTRLTRVGLLVDAFQHRCLDPFGLLFIDYSVLRVLELVGPPHRMSPTELVRDPGAVERWRHPDPRPARARRARRPRPDPDDRRKVVVELTPDGLRTADEANATYMRERERLLDGLSSDEVDQLDAAVDRLLEVLSTASVTSARRDARHRAVDAE